MNTNDENLSVRFKDFHFSESSHICMVYENEEQRNRIVTDFLSIGLSQGELVQYFTDYTDPEDIRSWLKDTGVEVQSCEEHGHFTIKKAENAYCPHGHFIPHEVIDGMKARYKVAEANGYKASRVASEMSWALRGIPGSERVLEYEALINLIAVNYPHIGMCQYDANKFDGATIFKVLQIHPYIIAHGQVVHNPYYLTSEKFLSGFRVDKTL